MNDRLSSFARALGLALSVAASPALLESGGAWAKGGAEDHARLQLVVEHDRIAPGDKTWIGVYFELDPGWHVYWKNPGDSGDAPKIQWTLPPGWSMGELRWPTPERISLEPLVNFGYHDAVLLSAPLGPPPEQASASTRSFKLKAEVDYLVCSDVCIPGSARLEREILLSAGSDAGKARKSRHATLFSEFRKHWPEAMPLGWKPGFRIQNDQAEIEFPGVASMAKVTQGPGAPQIFIENMNATSNSALAEWSIQGESLIARLPVSDQYSTAPASMAGLIKLQGGRVYEWLAAPVSGTASVGSGAGESARYSETSLLGALLLALLGGMILNLMPCVFPVLFIKALSLVEQARESESRHRRHALAYTLGILVSFWILAGVLIALRAGGAALGWGFQLQQPAFIFGLVVLLTLMAFNLLGVFEISGAFGFGSKLAARKGYSGSFFTGVLATVVATPCTAPFMGTALGFALTQPAWAAMSVFTALGIGLAIPYLMLSLSPALGRVLPRPGRWMESFKQFMAFPLLATVLWLIVVMANQTGAMGWLLPVSAVLVLGGCAWMYGRWPARTWVRLLALVIAITSVVFGVTQIRSELKPQAGSVAGSKPSAWAPWSEQEVQKALAAGQPVFVDFTADWCVTCKVNERIALDRAEVQAEFKRRNVLLLKADWTHEDPLITQALAKYGRTGVPLYLLFPGRAGAEPQIWPQILTPSIVLDRLKSLNAT